jgi:hypothetical protein
MQRTEIIERVRHLDEVVHRAEQACSEDAAVPDQLKRSVSVLSAHTNQARQLLLNEQDDDRVVHCIDDLEALGDLAKRLCTQAGVTSRKLADAIAQAHSELSSLKRQLH